jgi:hypothetical protein
MPSYESSMRNLAKARARWRPPRPWRSTDESRMIRRYVFVWYTGRGSKPSGRAWAKQLGISHTWLQKLVRQSLWLSRRGNQVEKNLRGCLRRSNLGVSNA